MPSTDDVPNNAFVVQVGSRPLVVDVENWQPGTIEDVTLDDVIVTFDGDPVWTVV